MPLGLFGPSFRMKSRRNPVPPTVRGVTSGATSTDATSTVVSIPSNVVAKDLLIIVFIKDGAGGPTWPTGWTSMGLAFSGGATWNARCRISDGSTASVTLTHTAEQTAWACFAIAGARPVIPAKSTHLADISTAPAMTALTHAFPTDTGVLWIGTVGWDANATCTGYPAGLPNNRVTAVGTTTESVGIACATVGNISRTVTPAAFAVSASSPWQGYLIAVPALS